MQIVERADALRAQVAAWHGAGDRVAFVPTMGNLHAGHYSLLALARQHAARVVASIFVNPTQFGPHEDLDRYPRTPQADEAGLRQAGCDLLFRPEVEEMYPFGPAHCVQVRVPDLTRELDGAARPGHFDGVATVVLRLFHLVQPDLAVFGRKDFQQWRVIDYLVRDLSLPIEILAAPICRDRDGLALSSRNQYLTPAQRAIAPELHQSLVALRAAWAAGAPVEEVEAEALARLAAAGFVPDYVTVRRGQDLLRPAAGEREGLVALAAVRLGGTRLIDNLELHPPEA